MKDTCFGCRRKNGYIQRDKGCHTVIRKKCECCGEIGLILPDRHWKGEYPNGMVLQSRKEVL